MDTCFLQCVPGALYLLLGTQCLRERFPLLDLSSSQVATARLDWKDLILRVEDMGGQWADFSLMSCDASWEGANPVIPFSYSEAAEAVGPFLSWPAAFSAVCFPFAFLSLSILAKFSFLCSQFSAHSEREIQRGGEKVRRKKGWGGDL